jgi:hypothetical protein
MSDPCDAELAAASCRLIRAFPIALMASLRIDHNLKSGRWLGVAWAGSCGELLGPLRVSLQHAKRILSTDSIRTERRLCCVTAALAQPHTCNAVLQALNP